MVTVILTISFILSAAACKAVADTLRDHFDVSIFKSSNPNFWNPVISWEHAKKIPFTKYHLDAWHLANSMMIIFFDVSIVSISTICFPWQWYWFVVEFFAIGTLFVISFNLFYNKILKK